MDFCGIGWKKTEKSFQKEDFASMGWQKKRKSFSDQISLEARWRFNTTDTWWMRELMLCMQTLKRSFVNFTKLKAGNFKHPEGSWVEALPSTQLNWMYVAAYVQFSWVEYTGNSTQLSVPWTECVLLLSGPKTAWNPLDIFPISSSLEMLVEFYSHSGITLLLIHFL